MCGWVEKPELSSLFGSCILSTIPGIYHTGKGTNGRPTDHQKYYAKLAKRYYGPFQILKPINETAYRLRLPSIWLIHNAFHVSLLKPYKGEPSKEPLIEEPPEFEEQEEFL